MLCKYQKKGCVYVGIVKRLGKGVVKRAALTLAMLFLFVQVMSMVTIAQGVELLGTFTLSAEPVINYVSISGGAISITPGQEIDITVNVTHNNNLENLEEMEIRLWYDEDDNVSVTQGDFDDLGTAYSPVTYTAINWSGIEDWDNTNISAEFGVQIGGDTDDYWKQVGNVAAPSKEEEVGDFVFRVRVGKIAKATDVGSRRWHIGAWVRDVNGNEAFGHLEDGVDVNFYAGITDNGSNIDWGTIEPGITYGGIGATASTSAIDFLANDTYAHRVKASSTWEVSGTAIKMQRNSNPIDADQFQLRAASTTGAIASFSDAGTININPNETVSASLRDDISANINYDPVTAVNNYLYIQVSDHQDNNPDAMGRQFTGTITYMISNEP